MSPFRQERVTIEAMSRRRSWKIDRNTRQCRSSGSSSRHARSVPVRPKCWCSCVVPLRPPGATPSRRTLRPERPSGGTGDKRRKRAGRRKVELADGRHRLLLCAQPSPYGQRASQQQHQLAVYYSITSSARSRIAGGTVRPSALAVLRLTTSSNLVGCSTGRSAGLSPLRILSTKPAARRNRSR